MTRPGHVVRITLMAVTLAWWPGDPAVAAPPANDDFCHAIAGTEPLPFTSTIDSTEATPAGDDPSVCFYVPSPTVWYSFTPSQNVRVRATTLGSDYDTTLSVYTGTRGDLTDVACNDDIRTDFQSSVIFDATAGQTYFFMIGTSLDQFGRPQPAGHLVFTVDVGPSPLTISLGVDTVGFVDRRGDATLRGTATCSRPAIVELAGRARQRAGRAIIEGIRFMGFACDGKTPWKVTIDGSNGLFAGGPVDAFVLVQTRDAETGEFAADEVLTEVRLRGSPVR